MLELAARAALLACLVGRAGGAACALRLTLAGVCFWLARAAAVNRCRALPLCGNREWSLRSQAAPPTQGGACAGPRMQRQKAKANYSYSSAIKLCCELVTHSHHSLCLSLTAHQSYVPGWWIGCPVVGPIRRCHRVKVPGTVLTSLRRHVNGRRRRAWARERIPGPPAHLFAGDEPQPSQAKTAKNTCVTTQSKSLPCPAPPPP